ncbi:MAG TPA: DUF1326 domain-containing protein [Acidimicrobiia bacterium]|jgi:hypothetical protein|nr:DUF1326 domain-containing protein [Acidimicrobiia bacterium]
MAWNLTGTYFESCSCDAICPCTWSGLSARATNDRCNFLLAFKIDRGEVDGVDVSGLGFGMLGDTPPVMAEGNWRVGLFLDAAASDEQRGKLGAVLGGELGGPPAMLGPLIGEFLGVEVAPIAIEEAGGRHHVRIGEFVDIEVAEFTAGEHTEPVRLTNVFHPANTTLTVAPTVTATVSAMGVSFGRPGESGFAAPFAWSA